MLRRATVDMGRYGVRLMLATALMASLAGCTAPVAETATDETKISTSALEDPPMSYEADQVLASPTAGMARTWQ